MIRWGLEIKGIFLEKNTRFDPQTISFSKNSRDVGTKLFERNFPNPNKFRYFFDH